MVLTYSKMLPVGTKLPEFDLLNVSNNQNFSSKNLSGDKGKVIMFICNHCPYVIHYWNEIISLTSKYQNIEFVAISSNDAIAYPQDNPDSMKELAKKFQFPYLYDETQEVAKKYLAQCTPEFYLFDRNNLLIYRGRLDNSSPDNNKKITGEDLRSAIDNFLGGKNPVAKQYPSMGCNIKWKI